MCVCVCVCVCACVCVYTSFFSFVCLFVVVCFYMAGECGVGWGGLGGKAVGGGGGAVEGGGGGVRTAATC